MELAPSSIRKEENKIENCREKMLDSLEEIIVGAKLVQEQELYLATEKN